MNGQPEVSIITETLNLTEGQGVDRLRAALAYACRLAERDGNVEIPLADVLGPNLIVDDLLRRFPQVRHVPAPNAGYDGMKNIAAQRARGRYLVFLDSDCEPLDDAWLGELLAPLRQGIATATAGVTHYDGASLLYRTMSMMDFGFLLGDDGDTVGCYASNNCAFLRQTRIDIPPPDGPMRCTCYAHAQHLARIGQPMRRVPTARARHELPAVFKERWRRGFDLVAACWVDPALAEAELLGRGIWAAPSFVAINLRQDWRRLGRGRDLWGWSGSRLAMARALAIALRLIDLGGAIKALALGPDRRWTAQGGWKRAGKPA